ncbi:MAG: outer membrane protein assembly factor BamD [Nitrospirota bacterium]|nr:outer membrane protein assembly factor BamD [Nitrospirota bacterium]
MRNLSPFPGLPVLPRLPLVSLLLLTLLASGCATYKDESARALRETMGIDVKPVHTAEGVQTKITYSAEEIMANAEGHYRLRQFPEAVDEYGRFMELHTTHPWAPYAQFQKGVSWVRQFRSGDRDPTIPFKAGAEFDRLIANYPGSPPEAQARVWRKWADEQLAIHTLSIARFYLRTGRFDPALGRLQELAETYPDTAAAADGAYYTARVLAKSGKPDEAAQAYQRFIDSGRGSKKLRHRAEAALKKHPAPAQ